MPSKLQQVLTMIEIADDVVSVAHALEDVSHVKADLAKAELALQTALSILNDLIELEN